MSIKFFIYCYCCVSVFIQSYITILGFWMGFCMYGAISLLGTISLEVAPIQITGAALAAVGAAANSKAKFC